jgi:hypothetical protein
MKDERIQVDTIGPHDRALVDPGNVHVSAN